MLVIYQDKGCFLVCYCLLVLCCAVLCCAVRRLLSIGLTGLNLYSSSPRLSLRLLQSSSSSSLSLQRTCICTCTSFYFLLPCHFHPTQFIKTKTKNNRNDPMISTTEHDEPMISKMKTHNTPREHPPSRR
ncbi:hypothetical protein BP00DRAFT_85089 [Aspergillus indologenus CBS 114.80]|uniref:Uncharacterized protein n=1 Tax=Aspergillus indologenus CBS 114.80 TaxID=1450541 RepID=A0A2V5IYT0_9EURO|nr:hypothetical protein BP00DRAFT_85089 [Aspergillus indologenus CBS 114.80]